jgi:UDP:flavonoid glycosyltransferase YjiC (YdhE family)
MAVIALNWELGADFGHISRFLTVAKALRARGHRPVCILKDISRAESLLGSAGIEYLQAPVWLPKSQGLPPDLNFTETLMRFGFLQPEGLTAMVRAWRQLWHMLDARLLLLDLAPTACLAARGLGIPRLLVGNSYCVPPTSSPLPAFRWWQKTPGENTRLAETEKRVLANINASAMRLGIPALSGVGDLFAGERRVYCAFPELDVYGPRDDGHYIGPINNVDSGAPPFWPAGNQPKVFAYIKPHYKHFDALLAAMQQTEARFLIFAPGIAEASLRKYGGRNIAFSRDPLHMGEVIPQSALVVCHAGGTTDVALRCGKPVLQLPMQMEQTMTSQRTAALGAALHLPLDGNPGELRRLFKRLLGEPAFGAAAMAFAEQHRDRENDQNVETLVALCEENLAAC